MNNTLIYIGDDLLDLDPSTVIAITIQAINVGDLKTRNVSYTNQFKVRTTENNCRIFGYVHSEWSRSVKPYRYNSCKVIQNGVEVMPEAVCIIQKYEKGYFVLNIYESIYDIFAELEGLKIKDINPIPASAWDNFAMDAARTNTSGIIAAILQWGHSTSDIFEAGFFMPCFFYHTFITEILTHTGLTLSGDILTDSWFTDLVIPFPCDTYEEDTSSGTVPAYVAKGTKSESTTTSVTPNFMGGILAGDKIYLQAVNVEPTIGTIDTPVGWTRVSEETFTWGTTALFYKTASGSEAGTQTVTRSASSGAPSSYFMAQMYQYRDASATVSIDATDDHSVTGNSTITWRALTLSNAHRTLAAFFVDYNGTSLSAPTGYADGTAVDSSSLISGVNIGVFTKADTDTAPAVTSSGSFDGWSTWHIALYGTDASVLTTWNDLWPDIEVKDILKDFFVRFGLIAKQKKGVLYLKTIEAIIGDRTNAVDWSAKLTKTDKPIDFQTKYAQSNYFEYQNGENDPELGRGTLTIDNETLDPIGTIFTSVFESVETGPFGVTQYPSAKMNIYDEDSTDNTDIKNSPPFTLLTLRARDPVDDPAITFAVTSRTDYKVAYFVDTDRSKDSNFQYFVDEFYPKYESALQKNKIIEKEYLLTEYDIHSYDSHKIMWDGEGYYLINKIINFIPGRITKVQLLKVG